MSYSSPASALRTRDVVAPSEDGAWPVFVVAHGTNQRGYDVRDWAIGIAERGAMTYNVDWSGAMDREAVERLTCAVGVAVADATDHGGDTSRVVFVGHSLGAAVGAAASLGGLPAPADCAVAEGDALPDAFVGYEGPYDATAIDDLNGGVTRETAGGRGGQSVCLHRRQPRPGCAAPARRRRGHRVV